jgi:hypothetical protein
LYTLKGWRKNIFVTAIFCLAAFEGKTFSQQSWQSNCLRYRYPLQPELLLSRTFWVATLASAAKSREIKLLVEIAYSLLTAF